MASLQFATVGGDETAILLAMREFPVAKVYLLFHKDSEAAGQALRDKLRALLIDAVLLKVEGDIITGTLKAVGEVMAKEAKRFDTVQANIAGGSPLCGCSLLMAAFVHGIDAVHVVDGKAMRMPVLRFSYIEVIGEEKFRILDALQAAGGKAPSLEFLAEKTGLAGAAVVRHLRSPRGPPGLEDLGVVSIARGDHGIAGISITDSGRLLLVGRHAGHAHGA
jgi:hypothetical protein